MQQRLADLLGREGLTALWVTTPEHVRLISGFTSPEDAKVLVTPSETWLYTDARYTAQADEECRVPHFIGAPPRANALKEMYEHARVRFGDGPVGVEAAHLTVHEFETLKAAWNADLVATTGLIESVRLSKTNEEIQAIREAQRVADEAYAEVRPTITAGRKERDVALDLEIAMRRRGAAGPAFDIIVASGARSAMPHGVASDKIIEDGDLVTIDMGAVVNGYHSDMTRTIAVGSVSDELRRMYDAVLEAEEACVAAVKPGIRCADLDQIARDLLAKHDLAPLFAHSLGHGVGLAIHEGPSLSSASEDVLAPGMIITIEPGVYRPGVGGVRIEDLLLVTEDGFDVLSKAPKERA
ncbi:M24 family metallopeptidase [Deinococcus yavapaiensis]|nr:aminopeptidase P family protein [Deinococcus yavapaiensis]